MKLDPFRLCWWVHNGTRWVSVDDVPRRLTADLCILHAPTAYAHVLNNTMRVALPPHPHPLHRPPRRRVPLFDMADTGSPPIGAYRHLLDWPKDDRA